MFQKWTNKPWYPYTVAGVTIIILYVILVNINHVLGGVKTFIGFFTPVLIGAVIAYMMNQLSVFYQAKIFHRIKKDSRRNLAGIALAVITVLAILAAAIVLLVPQLISSVTTFANNLKGYEESIKTFILDWNFLSDKVTARILDFLNSSGGILEYITNYAVDNLPRILPAVANTGRGIVLWVVAFILAIYFLAGKQMIKGGLKRLIHALSSKQRFNWLMCILQRCNRIIGTFLVYNILDAIIIGLANTLFMLIANMQYIGLISFVVGVTNLVPTFGPIVGAIIGLLLLVLVNPWHALAFLIFTIAIQICDAYIIKPKLFGNILGIPGVWVLISVVVFGRAIGVVGILLAIPAIAIIDFLYQDHFLPWLEARHRLREEKKEEENSGKDGPLP